MKEKIIKGGIAVVLRQIISFPLNIGGVAVTSKLLDPADFGVLAFLLPFIAVGMLLVDLGISQALVQTKSSPSQELLARVQKLKLLGLFVTVIVLSFLTPWLIKAFSLPQHLALIFPAAGLIAWTQSQREHQSVFLKRDVDWETLARVEMIEIVVYNLSLMGFAFLLKNAWCFVLALVVRSVTGGLLLRVATQRSSLMNLDEEHTTLESLIKFGLPLQATSLSGMFNGLVNPVIVGSTLGINAVGLVNWSTSISALPQLPLRPLPDFLFSVLSSRERGNRDDQEILNKTSFLGILLMSFLLIFIFFTIEPIIHFFAAQWVPALPVVSVLLLTNIISFPTLLIAAKLKAKGRSMEWLQINILGTLLLWVLAFGLTRYFGLLGYAYAWLLASFIPHVILSLIAKKYVGLRIYWFDSLYVIICVYASLYFYHELDNYVEFVQRIGLIFGFFLIIILPILYLRRANILGWKKILTEIKGT